MRCSPLPSSVSRIVARPGLAVLTAVVAGGLALAAPAASADTVPADVTPSIVGGDTVTEAVPYISALHSGGSFVCTSAIVAPEWVLTAAHCVDGGSDFSVRVGSLTRSSGGTEATVSEVHKAEDFNWPEGDMALLRLAEPVQAEYATMATAEDLQAGQEVQVFGWGSQNADWSGPLPEDLQTTTGTTYDCEDASKVVCTDTAGSIAGGDSGGPAMVKSAKTGEWVHLGVCAIGHQPANDGYAAYTSDAEYRDWIKQVAGI